jgi:type IV secretion system protein VirB2
MTLEQGASMSHISLYRGSIALLILALITVFICEPAFAQSGALFDSGTNFLSALQDLLTSTWARIVAIIAVVFLGFMWMFGRLSMALAMSTIGGIILVFGAPAIVDGIAGSL